jgi:hypothetical protein
MPMVAQPLCELPEPRKMDQRLVAVCAKKKMECVDTSRNGCATIGMSQPAQCDIPRDFAWYATVREVEAEL